MKTANNLREDSSRSILRQSSGRVPDIRYINQQVPIAEIARSLDLKFGTNGNIHCWNPERHQHGDRTASVGIRKTNNTVKCFGCDAGPMGPIDLVMAVLSLSGPGTAANWIAARFHVPDLPPKKHLTQPKRNIFRVGFEDEIGLLVRSGIWARLSTSARSIAPVLLELAERNAETRTICARVSYRTITRYSGVASPNAIKGALEELQDIGWLSSAAGRREPGSGPVRSVSSYLLTPRSDEFVELAHANSAQMCCEIETQRTLRSEVRTQRRRRSITK